MLLPVAYQNQFNSVYVRGYWLPETSNSFWDDILSAKEKSTLSIITSPAMRRQKTWSFILTRMVLGDVLEQDPKSIEIYRAGKPRLEPVVILDKGDRSNDMGRSMYLTVHFNVSHSENLWVIVWSFDQEVGIDVQKIDASINYQAIMCQFFTALEQTAVKTVFDFFDIWTKKEALLKLRGLSFAHMPKISINTENLLSLDIAPEFKAHLAFEISNPVKLV